MTNLAAPPVSTRALKANRVLAIVFDGLAGLLVVAALVVLVVGLAASFAAATLSILLGIWTALVGLFSLPALAVLYLSKPRVPLRERSALVASASWFGRVLWSTAVFSLSIVIGSVAGVVASGATERGEDFGSGVGVAITTLSTMVLWPALLCVGAIAYVVMGIRWCLDLGSIVAEDGGVHVRALFEHRWTGPLSVSPKWSPLVDVLVEMGLSLISRSALVATLITVGLNFALFVWSWA